MLRHEKVTNGEKPTFTAAKFYFAQKHLNLTNSKLIKKFKLLPLTIKFNEYCKAPLPMQYQDYVYNRMVFEGYYNPRCAVQQNYSDFVNKTIGYKEFYKLLNSGVFVPLTYKRVLENKINQTDKLVSTREINRKNHLYEDTSLNKEIFKNTFFPFEKELAKLLNHINYDWFKPKAIEFAQSVKIKFEESIKELQLKLESAEHYNVVTDLAKISRYSLNANKALNEFIQPPKESYTLQKLFN